jgi:hypothetical protein
MISEIQRNCLCSKALQSSIITAADAITEEAKERLDLLIGRYLK